MERFLGELQGQMSGVREALILDRIFAGRG